LHNSSSKPRKTRTLAKVKGELLQVSSDKPFRGPRFCREDDFKYTNSSTGDIICFKGTEKATFRRETIHRLGYACGIISNNE